MPKYIKKKDLKNAIDCCTWYHINAPSIDIVRCKECKHNYNKALNHGKMKPRCDFTDRVLNENDFCSYGEKKGADDETN